LPVFYIVTTKSKDSIAVLGGEVAVPCNPQSAIAGLNSRFEALFFQGQAWKSGDDDRVPRNGNL